MAWKSKKKKNSANLGRLSVQNRLHQILVHNIRKNTLFIKNLMFLFIKNSNSEHAPHFLVHWHKYTDCAKNVGSLHDGLRDSQHSGWYFPVRCLCSWNIFPHLEHFLMNFLIIWDWAVPRFRTIYHSNIKWKCIWLQAFGLKPDAHSLNLNYSPYPCLQSFPMRYFIHQPW